MYVQPSLNAPVHRLGPGLAFQHRDPGTSTIVRNVVYEFKNKRTNFKNPTKVLQKFPQKLQKLFYRSAVYKLQFLRLLVILYAKPAK